MKCIKKRRLLKRLKVTKEKERAESQELLLDHFFNPFYISIAKAKSTEKAINKIKKL